MSRAKRNRNRISYYEPEEPSFDNFIFCSSCGDYVYEYCSIHGRLLVIPDDEVPPPPGPPAPRAALPLPRAALSLPRAFLHLAPSTIPGAGIGVFSTLTLPTGVRFGPYRGLKTQAVTSAYCWQIFDGERKPSHVLDARDANKSNWMRYVNCSRHFSEQNLVAFQYQGQLYYRTIKIIPRFTELLVFYGSEFASQLRVDLRRYHAPCTHTLVKCEAENEEDTKIPEEKLVTETAVDNKENVIQTRYPLEVEQIYDDSKHSSEGDFLGFRLNEWKNVNVVQKPDPLEEDIYDEIEESKHQSSESESLKSHLNEHMNENISVNENENISLNENETITLNEMENDNYSKREQMFDEKPIFNDTTHSFVKKVATNDHNKMNTYSCPICVVAFSTKWEFINHDIKTHNSKKNYKACNICDYKTEKSFRLKIHMESHSMHKYKCDICGYETRYSKYLQRHTKTHAKPTCKICKDTFETSKRLQTHMRLHKENTYDCTVCKLKFIIESEFITHFKTHTEKRPHTCTVCGKPFRKPSCLKRHMMTHSHDKPLACEICKRGFAQMYHLKHHMKVHTNEVP